MRIAGATVADAAPLAAILGDWVRETGWMPVLHSREGDIGFLTRLIETEEVFVLRAPEPVGFAAVSEDEVSALYLAASARGQGGGKALLDQIKDGRTRLTLWTFQANAGARRFYAREGFREVRRTDGADNDECLPDIRLEWQRGQI